MNYLAKFGVRPQVDVYLFFLHVRILLTQVKVKKSSIATSPKMAFVLCEIEENVQNKLPHKRFID